MKNFKLIAIAFVVGFIVLIGTQWVYGKKIDAVRTELRKEREANAEILVVKNAEIGDYTYRLGIMEEDLEDAQALTDEQRLSIDVLQDELNAKVDVISGLSVQVDSLNSQGTAEVVYVLGDTIKYNINENKQGYTLDLVLEHPSGDYNYTIKQDPLTMELYLLKEKGTELRIGSIRFPNNPHVRVTKWDLLYNPDTRSWYQRLWDEVHFSAGIFAGGTNGIMGMAGYKNVMVGPVLTDAGTSMGIMYRIK